VDVSAALRGHARRGREAPALAASMDPEQAVEAFRRILGGDAPAQVAVSVRPLPEVFERARTITAERLAATLLPEAGDRHARPDLETSYVAPRGELEERLAAIWADVLGLDRVGTADRFFELGGHSLLVMQVVSRVREQFLVDLPLGAVFETSTIAELAIVIVQRQAEQMDPKTLASMLAEIGGVAGQEAGILRQGSQEEVEGGVAT
jgi:phthiocerol/phenolphthiocerol synthesis type-I polyketide synthase E